MEKTLAFEPANVELVAVIGLILLLFSLGLEFDQDEFYGNLRSLLISGGTALRSTSSRDSCSACGWGHP